MFKSAILGCRGRARAHAKAYESITRGKIVAICDMNEEALHEFGDAFDIGQRYTDIDQMLEYYDAVRAETYRYLDSLTEAGLAEAPNPKRPGYTIAEMFSHLMIEEGQHLGQVAYIRGIQRGLGG